MPKKTNQHKAMLEGLFQKAVLFLKQPEKAFAAEKKTDVSQAFIYLAILSLVGAVLGGIVTAAMALPGAFALLLIPAGYLMGIIGAVIMGLWLHLWAYVFGAKGGLHETLKAAFYGGTPVYLLGWIPFIGFLFSLWSVYLQWLGLKGLQGMKGDKAAIAVIVAFVIPMAIAGLIALFALSMFAYMPVNTLPPGMEMPADFQLPA